MLGTLEFLTLVKILESQLEVFVLNFFKKKLMFLYYIKTNKKFFY